MLEALDVLHEVHGLPAFPLPDELAGVYGGSLGFPQPRLFANFVSSLDGVVAIPGVPASTKLISDRSDLDRFVMGLLRACADCLVMGASTFRGSSEARWTPGSIYPPAEAPYAELRRGLGRSEGPELAVVTRSGSLDPDYPALEAGALVFTTRRGAERLTGALPPASTVVALGDDVDPKAIVENLRERGHRLILSEGGPTFLGSLLDDALVERALPHALAPRGRPVGRRGTPLARRADAPPPRSPAGRPAAQRAARRLTPFSALRARARLGSS